MKLSYLLISLLILSFSNAKANVVTGTSHVLTAYQVWLALNADCSSPVKVIDNGTAGKAVDIISSVDFGAGTLPADGTYHCIIVVLGDTTAITPAVTGTVASTNDLCVAGTKYTQDTCGTGSSSVLPDGTTTTCVTGQVDKVAGYISTTGTAGADGHDGAHSKLLNAPIVVAGASVSRTLYVSDPDGYVNQNGSCGQDSNAVLGVR